MNVILWAGVILVACVALPVVLVIMEIVLVIMEMAAGFSDLVPSPPRAAPMRQAAGPFNLQTFGAGPYGDRDTCWGCGLAVDDNGFRYFPHLPVPFCGTCAELRRMLIDHATPR